MIASILILLLIYWELISIFNVLACAHAQLPPALRDPLDCSTLGFSVHGTLQARILEWVTISNGDPPNARTEPMSLQAPAVAGGYFTNYTTWEAPF